MARIIALHPNASKSINGIRFEHDSRGQLMSVDDVPLHQAAAFQGEHFKVITTAADRQPEPAANLTVIHGPAGKLHVGGDLSEGDLAALRKHWEQGAIEMPQSEAVRRPPPASEQTGGGSPTLTEGQPMGDGLNGSLEGTAAGLIPAPPADPAAGMGAGKGRRNAG